MVPMFDKFTSEELERLYDGHREQVRIARQHGVWGIANYHASRATEIAVVLAERAEEQRNLERQIPLFVPEHHEPGA
jgi:hypothetical protein